MRHTTITCLLVLLTWASVSPVTAELQRVKYNHPGLTVDLGVGLWGWPLPMDYDGDGDLDLIVSCSDVPYNGVYLFENPGGDRKMPDFKPAVRLGSGLKNVTVSFDGDQPRVMIPTAELTGFAKRDFKAHVKVFPKDKFIADGRIRANQWSYADYDGDGALDIVVGHGHWGDYGWDNAFNDKGEWTRGPLHGYVYILRNTGTTKAPKYDQPFRVNAGDAPVDVFGMPSPNFADFDNDGDLDLLCGDFIDGFTYFQNIGTRTKPRYAKGRELSRDGKLIEMPLCMIVVVAIDWDKDGDTDLVVGQEDGRVALVEHTGNVRDGMPIFEKPRFFQQQAEDVKFGALITPVSVDWDNDGDEDIIAGNTAGEIGFIENLDGGNPPRWAPPKLLEVDGQPITIMAGENGSIQGPAERKWGYTTISVADWDHDGLLDIVANSIWGKIIWYRNVGTKKNAKLTAAQPVEVQWKGTPPKPAWNWWNPDKHEMATQWRTTPVVVDWNKDGLNDIVMLDHEGYLALYPRERRGDQFVLLPGERVFFGGTFDNKGQGKVDASQPLRLNDGEAGKSGRRKLCIVDWDGDGRLDLLVNTVNCNLMRNASTKDGRTIFVDMGPLDSRRLAGHTTSPTTVDWNKDGKPDLLVGAEDGYLYHLEHKDALPPTSRASKDFETDDLKVTGQHFQIDTLNDKGLAFANRKYVWYDVPQKLEGWQYTRTFGGERATINVTAKRDTTIHMATAPYKDGSQLDGWNKAEGLQFGYTDGGRTRVQVYQRDLKAGQSLAIPQGNWTGSMLLLPAEKASSAESPPAPAPETTRAHKSDKPNVLFIAVDDMRVDLNCYGQTWIKSPHIDALAKRGTLFNRAYCQQAVCNPSRASIMTGLRPSTLGIWDLPTHFRERQPNVVTLPQLFKQNGYFTQNIGKIFHNWRQDDYKGDPKSWSVPAVMHYNSHGNDKAIVKGELPPNLMSIPKCEMRDVPDEAYFDGRIAAGAVKALGELKKKDQPFFLAVGFWKPHSHFNAPKKYWDMYDRDKIAPPSHPKPPTDVPPLAMHDSREILRSFKGRPGGKPTADDAIAMRHGYYAAISYVDAQIGKVIDELDRLNLRDNTVIVFWSDHGYHLGEHALWAKTSNFELDARVPMIIATPQHKGGQRTDAIVELLDVYPTLADLCSLPAPKNLEGKSLRPVLNDPTKSVKTGAFTWHPRPAYPPPGTNPTAMGYSMRISSYRYTEWRDFNTGKILARELYDHRDDENETVNLANDAKYAKTIALLENHMSATHPATGTAKHSTTSQKR